MYKIDQPYTNVTVIKYDFPAAWDEKRIMKVLTKKFGQVKKVKVKNQLKISNSKGRD